MDANPFAILSLIVAPAILTNACSVLVMSTSNRLARAMDRARELAKQLESAESSVQSDVERRHQELDAVERRALLLLRGLQSFYLALGSFAIATLVSLLGAILVPLNIQQIVRRCRSRASVRDWSPSAQSCTAPRCCCRIPASPSGF